MNLQDMEKQLKFLTDKVFELQDQIKKLEDWRQSLREWAEENEN